MNALYAGVVSPSTQSIIEINGNAQLAAFADGGVGSKNDPYIIENRIFDGNSSGTALLLNRTDAFLIIRNCTFINSGSWIDESGLELVYSHNVFLVRNYASYNKGNGIRVDHSKNVTIFENEASYNDRDGISLDTYGEFCNITSNVMRYNKGSAIFMLTYTGNLISKNTMVGNGISLSMADYGIDTLIIETSNTINGKPVYFYYNMTGLVPANYTNAGQVILFDCHYSVIQGVDVSGGSVGIFLGYCTHIDITNNTARHNTFYGIYIAYSDHNSISSNDLSYNIKEGLYMVYANRNVVRGNLFSYNRAHGLYVLYSVENTIIQNHALKNNYAGIHLSGSNDSIISENFACYSNSSGISLKSVGTWRISSNNTISNNIITNNGINAIYLSGFNNSRIIANNISYNGYSFYVYKSGANLIYLNTIIGNKNQIPLYSLSTSNSWDNGSRGNYWGDYSSRYPSATNGGMVWKTPYSISGNDTDRYPLVSPNGSGSTPINYPPIITSPGSITFYANESGHSLSWNVADTTTNTQRGYRILRNGIQITSGTWTSGSPITTTLSGLPVGTYTYTIAVQDGLGGTANDSVVVCVLNVAPTITSPDDVLYDIGTTGHSLAWTATDASTGSRTYTVYRNGVQITSGTWTSGTPIKINIDGLPAGTYNFTIAVQDGLGGTTRDSLAVIVHELNIAPVISSPGNIIYNHGARGNYIAWYITDSSIGTAAFIIYRDGQPVTNGLWSDGFFVYLNVDYLPVGEYNYTIVAIDGLGGIAHDVVVVSIQNIAPSVSSPRDVSFTQGSTGNVLSWTSVDTSVASATYQVYQDSVLIASGTWVSENPVAINVDGLTPGSHNITMVVNDGFGGNVQDSVFVEVYARSSQTLDFTIPIAVAGVVLTGAGIIVVKRHKIHTRRVFRQRLFF